MIRKKPSNPSIPNRVHPPMASEAWSPERLRHVRKEQLYARSEKPPRSRWFTRLLAGLLLAWLLSGAITPWTGLFDWNRAFPELGLRLEDAEARRANAWFVGSSTALHHALPAVLDEETARCGLRWYTFGFQRATPPESFFIAHELLDRLPTDSLAVLVFEVQPEEPLTWDEVASLRHAAQLDLSETVRRLAHLPWGAPGGWRRQLESARVLLWGWVQHVVSFVRPSQYLARTSPAADPRPERGFVELKAGDWRTGRLRESHAAWEGDRDRLLAQQRAIAQDFDLRRTLEDPTVNWECEGRLEPVLAQMQALHHRCEAAGIRCLFHFQKLWDTNGCLYFAALEKWGPDVVIESMGHAGLEALFDPDDRYDESHFLRSGAEKFSRLLGARLASTACDPSQAAPAILP